MPPPVPIFAPPETDQAPTAIVDYFDRAEALVNLTENLTDITLTQYQDILINASRKAAMRSSLSSRIRNCILSFSRWEGIIDQKTLLIVSCFELQELSCPYH